MTALVQRIGGIRKRARQAAYRAVATAAIAIASLALAGAPAQANSVQEPGETAGLATGAPLPEGLYFLNLANWGNRDTEPKGTALGVEIPALIWSTPLTLFGGRFELLVGTPLAEVGLRGSGYISGWYYPAIAPFLAWDLGNGLGLTVGSRFYLPASNQLTRAVVGNIGNAVPTAALSYTADRWNLTALVAYGIPMGTDSANRGGHHEWINYDLTATRTFGKWEFGVVGYGSADTTGPTGYKKQSQFALGPLVGYNFGPVILQVKLTTDVTQHNYGGHDTRFWTNLVIPIKL